MSKRAGVLAMVLAVTAGCGTGGTKPPTISAGSPSNEAGAAAAGASPTDITYPGANVRLVGTPALAAPAITAAAALKTYVTSGIFPGVASAAAGPPDIRLVSFSDNTRGDIQPDGSVKLQFQNVLAWAVVFHKVPYAGIGGPAPVAGGQSAANPAVPEDIAILVDATTGALLEAFADVPA